MTDFSFSKEELDFIVAATESHIAQLRDDHHYSDIRKMVNIKTGLVNKTDHHYKRAQSLKIETNKALKLQQRFEAMKVLAYGNSSHCFGKGFPLLDPGQPFSRLSSP